MEASKTDDPIDWARKYLIAASVCFSVLSFKIIGINDIRFTSKATHKISQFVEDATHIVDRISDEYSIIYEGVKCSIGRGRNLISLVKLEALYYLFYFAHSRDP